MRYLLYIPTFLLVFICAGANVYADPDEETAKAKELFQRAEGRYGAGEYQEALELYQQAYKRKPLAGFLFNLGQCERKLGRCDKALVHFREFIRQLPGAPNRETVEALIRECEAAVQKQEQTEKETEKKEPDRPVEPATAAVSSSREPSPPPGPEAEITARPREGLHPVWFWSCAGLAGALLVTGAVTGALTLDMSSEYKDAATSQNRKHDLKDNASITGNLSTVTIAAGATAAVAAGVLFFFTQWGGDSEGEQPRVSASVLPGGGGLSLKASF
jgi:tetratricopeptide (TPR) repeat protein